MEPGPDCATAGQAAHQLTNEKRKKVRTENMREIVSRSEAIGRSLVRGIEEANEETSRTGNDERTLNHASCSPSSPLLEMICP